MRKIALTKGKVALVDDVDFDYLSQWKWHAINGKYAARRQWYRENGKKCSHYILMHRVITKTPADMDTDHKNGDTLDNRRENLRVCTTAENLANRDMYRTRNTTGYKGVILDKKTGKYRAQICKVANGKRENSWLGVFDTAFEAGIAYEVEAKKRYGEFAKLKLLGV